MKKTCLVLCSFLILVLVVGCGNKKNTSTKIQKFSQIKSKSGRLVCTRKATASSGISPYFMYYLTYNGNKLLKLHSIEKITSDDTNNLDIYEKAYKNINKSYSNLKYYDTKVIRTDNSVERNTIINYAKIDVEKIIEIEGEKNNVFENGEAKVSKWLDFTSQFGVTCKED